jgi:hypothetical protein
MAQAVSRLPVTAEARIRSRVSPCGICGGHSGTGTGFFPSAWFSPVNCIAPVLHYKKKTKKLIIFIAGLHNKPQGCGASIALLRGPHKKEKYHTYAENSWFRRAMLYRCLVTSASVVCKVIAEWLALRALFCLHRLARLGCVFCFEGHILQHFTWGYSTLLTSP